MCRHLEWLRHGAAMGHAVVHLVQCHRGASAIPSDVKEVGKTYAFSAGQGWRTLSGHIAYLVTGVVIAAGGAWNARIVAEYFHFRGQTVSSIGLGAIISKAT